MSTTKSLNVVNNEPLRRQQRTSTPSTTNLYAINNELLSRQLGATDSSFSAKAGNPVRVSALLGHSRATGSPACAGDDGGDRPIVNYTDNEPKLKPKPKPKPNQSQSQSQSQNQNQNQNQNQKHPSSQRRHPNVNFPE